MNKMKVLQPRKNVVVARRGSFKQVFGVFVVLIECKSTRNSAWRTLRTLTSWLFLQDRARVKPRLDRGLFAQKHQLASYKGAKDTAVREIIAVYSHVP